MKRKFISRGIRWSIGTLTLDRNGREFDTETEAGLIETILRSGVNDGGLVIEVPTEKVLKESAAKFVAETFGVAIPVPVLTVPDVEAEQKALQEQEQIKQQQAEEEKRLAEEKRAMNAAYKEKRTKAPAKKTKPTTKK